MSTTTLTRCGSATVDRALLKDALTLVGKNQGRPHLPILSSVRIDFGDGELVLSAHNLDMGIIARIPASVSREGATLVPLKLLANLVKAGPATVELDEDDEHFVTVTGSGRAVLRPLHLEDYPRPLPPSTEKVGELDAVDLDTMARVLLAAANEEARPMLTGIFVDAGRAVCTDSYRMHVGTLSGDGIQSTLIPGVAARTFTAWKLGRGTLDVTASDGQITLTGRHIGGTVKNPRVVDIQMTVRLIEAAFPNWPSLWPPDVAECRGTVAIKPLMAAVDAIRQVTLGQINTPVTITAGEDGLLLTTAGGEGTASQRVPATLAADWPEVALNPTYLLAALKACEAGDAVTIGARDGLKPFTFRSGGTVQVLLMPMRVN